jgi:hypothetical protein
MNSEAISSSPKDDSLDEVNETILLVLSDEPFSSGRKTTTEHAFQKALYIVGLLIFCIFQSDISIRFRTNSHTAGRQIEPRCRSTFATSCCASRIKDEDTCSFLSSYEIMVFVVNKS